MSTTLTADLITWNTVGLDSNNVLSGPYQFLVGIRVTNTGANTATNINAKFNWESGSSTALGKMITIKVIDLDPYIKRIGLRNLTKDAIAAGDFFDFYFNIEIARDTLAYDKVRPYNVFVTADNAPSVTTAQPRQIYVEHLVSQNRNHINSVDGPTSLTVGDIAEYVMTGSTATNGYEQLEHFLTVPNDKLEILAIMSTYTASTPHTTTTIYENACTWDNDPSSPNYMSCLASGKSGGDITCTYIVKAIGAGTANLYAAIYDFSGSSYHYNSDYGVLVVQIDVAPKCIHEKTKVTTLQNGEIIEKMIKNISMPCCLSDYRGKPVQLSKNVKLMGKVEKFICFEKDALGKGMPKKKTYMCPEHPILVNGIEIQCNELVNGKSIYHKTTTPANVYTFVTRTSTFVNVQGLMVKTWSKSLWKSLDIPSINK